ncbi:hypothetical protein A2V49_03770 [candidate division WWE3 bacterium RBG_19FT_COMBO_34_6]|uniref:Uncharacterized protein n=1 Tax=candidate division WWE3 bacterium RBG_19FT_COMBO_34_6 TaxID=1802612 RepID=A0A1F4UKS8_UNCKA|nr:MAG: hypothetical protein A2V49_03770 [candidate division WWE3 bacterium RBG_19FT_COMBO_34_6]
MRYFSFKFDQTFKELRYKFFDSSYSAKYGFKPIWAVLSIVGISIILLYFVWPSMVKLIVVGIGLYLVYLFIMNLIAELKYRISYVNKSNKDENKILETNLAEPPIQR